MSATIDVYWPGITDAESDGQPFFHQHWSWPKWLATAVSSRRIRWKFAYLGVTSLLTFITDGLEEHEVDWVTPDELESAALKLISIAKSRPRRIKHVLSVYANTAGDSGTPEFIRDLEDIAASAAYARSLGQPKVTLQINY